MLGQSPLGYMQAPYVQTFEAGFLNSVQTQWQSYRGSLRNVDTRRPNINPKKQMTDREAKLLIVGGLRP